MPSRVGGNAWEPATAFRIVRGKLVDRVLAYSSVPDDLSVTDTMVDGLDWPQPLGRMASPLSEVQWLAYAPSSCLMRSSMGPAAAPMKSS